MSNWKTSAQQRKLITQKKKQPTQWEKVFVKHILDNGLISKVYEELTQFSSKKKKKKVKKEAEDTESNMAITRGGEDSGRR